MGLPRRGGSPEVAGSAGRAWQSPSSCVPAVRPPRLAGPGDMPLPPACSRRGECLMPPPVWPPKRQPESAPEPQAWPGPSNGGPAFSAYRPCGTRAPTGQEAVSGGKERHSPCRQNIYCPVGPTIHTRIKIQRMMRVKRQPRVSDETYHRVLRSWFR